MSKVLTTATLLGVVEQTFKFNPFILSMFFPMEMTFDTAEIYFDKVSQSGRLAPFVSPMVAGKPQRSQGHTRQSLVPAYVKPKHIVDPTKPMKTIAGERPAGELTVAQRRSWWRTHLLNEEELQILRREEWMACQAVLFGAVTIEGEDYPTQLVEFGRSPQNNITLVGAAKWDAVDKATYDPTPDLEDWAMYANGPIDTLVMDKEAWRLFSKFQVVIDGIKKDSGRNIDLNIDVKDPGMVASYKGMFGSLHIYVYSGQYVDDTGAKKPYLPPYYMIMGYTGYQGIRAYGAIMDAEAQESGLVTAKRYPKNWFTKDPSVENLMTQSAPLMVTEDADGFVVIKVAGN